MKKKESPLQGILKFAELEKGQLRFAVILFCPVCCFWHFAYISVAMILSNSMSGRLTAKDAAF